MSAGFFWQTKECFAVGAFFVDVGFSVTPFVFLPAAKNSDTFGGIEILLIFQLPAVNVSGKSSETIPNDQRQPDIIKHSKFCKHVNDKH